MHKAFYAVVISVLGSVLGGGCYRPTVAACELQCNDQRCPSGLACNDQGLCAATAMTLCDSLPDDAQVSPAAITIDVRDNVGGPVPGALVVFADASGQLVADRITGNDGIAVIEMEPGGSATVVRKPTGSLVTYATTYLSLWSGARIVSQIDIDKRERAVTIKWAPLPGAASYEVRTSCSDGVVVPTTDQPTAVVMVPVRCPTFDVIVHAGAATSSVTPPSVVLGGQTGDVVMPDDWKNSTAIPLTLKGRPSNVGMVAGVLGGWITPQVPSTAPFSNTIVNNTGSAPPWTAPTGINLMATMLFGAPDVPGTGQLVIDRLPAGATSYPRDFNGALLAWPGNATFDGQTRTLRWATTAPADVMIGVPSLAYAVLRYTRANLDVEWRIIAPGTAIQNTFEGGVPGASFVLPDVPGDRAFEPRAGDTLSADDITLLQVEDAALRGVIEILEPPGPDLFTVPELRHLTVATSSQGLP